MRMVNELSILGVDLAGRSENDTGICILEDGFQAWCRRVHSDAQIIDVVLSSKPDVVAIDAPLTFPLDRCCLEPGCDCRKKGLNIREAERELRRMGIRVFPCTFGGMRSLTTRGVLLRLQLESMDQQVIEVYPGATQDLLGIPRKKAGIEALARGLVDLDIKGDLKERSLTHDELDAITAAYTGWLFQNDMTIPVGSEDEGLIWVPNPRL